MLKIQLENDEASGAMKPNTLHFKVLETMLKKVIYGVGISNIQKKMFGTKENVKLHLNMSRIANVTDAYKYLKYVIQKPELVKYNNDLFDGMASGGTFHMYEDGRNMVVDIVRT